MEVPPLITLAESSTAPVARWRSLLMVILLLAIPPVLGLMGAEKSGSSPDAVALPGTLSGLMTVCAINLGIFFVLAGAVAWLGRPSRTELWIAAPCGLKAWGLGLGYSVLFRLGLGALMAAAVAGKAVLLWLQGKHLDSLSSFRPQIENMLVPAALRDPVYLLVVTTVVSFVVAGLREELWRAAVFAGVARWRHGFLATRRGQIGTSLVAAVAFGIGHLPQGWSGVLMIGALGFGLGMILLIHRSLWVAVLAHGFFNAASFLLLRVADATGLLDQIIGQPTGP